MKIIKIKYLDHTQCRCRDVKCENKPAGVVSASASCCYRVGDVSLSVKTPYCGPLTVTFTREHA